MHDGVKIYLAPWSSGKSSSAMALKVAVSREFEARLRHGGDWKTLSVNPAENGYTFSN